MAVYRQIYITFWQDQFILDLTPEEKYFYLYLMTNSKTKQCGCYEIPKKVMELETGSNRETVDKLLQRFIDYGKIKYDTGTSEILLMNWLKYNPINNVNIEKCVNKEFAEIKSRGLQGALKGLISEHTSPTKKKEKEKEQEKEQPQEEGSEKHPSTPYEKIKTLFHETCPSLPKVITMSDTRKEHVKARFKQHKYDLDIFRQLFEKAEVSDFLKGNNDRRWTANFDWLMNETNMSKVLEGRYENKTATPNKPIELWTRAEREAAGI